MNKKNIIMGYELNQVDENEFVPILSEEIELDPTQK